MIEKICFEFGLKSMKTQGKANFIRTVIPQHKISYKKAIYRLGLFGFFLPVIQKAVNASHHKLECLDVLLGFPYPVKLFFNLTDGSEKISFLTCRLLNHQM